MKIDPKTLQECGACQEDMDSFMKHGHGHDITAELTTRHADRFDWDWAASRLLNREGKAEYARIRREAHAEHADAVERAHATFHSAVQGRKLSGWASFVKDHAAFAKAAAESRGAAKANLVRKKAEAFGHLYERHKA